MARKLSDLAIKELSLVFAEKDGIEWGPRNEEARVLAVKSAEKGMVAKAFDVLKAYFQPDQEELGMPKSFPVSEADDNIDGDGDGPEDYNEIIRAICALYGDIGTACAISDDGARSAALVECIDTFLLGLDALRCCDDDEAGKAGARHSAADIASLHAAYDAITEIGKHQAAIVGHLEALGVTGATSSDDGETGKDEDDGPNSSRANDGDKAGAVTPDASDYADPGYQEDGKKRYPLDTEEHVRAAASYFGMEKNRSKYTKEQQDEIDAKIEAAEKKFGIGDDKAGPKVVIIPESKDGFEEADKAAEQEPEMTAEQIAALVAEGVAKALAASKTESDSVLAAAKAEAEAAKAQAIKAQAIADAAEAKAAEDREILKALSGVSSSHTPLSAAVAAQKSGGLADRMAREMKNNPQSTRI